MRITIEIDGGEAHVDTQAESRAADSDAAMGSSGAPGASGSAAVVPDDLAARAAVVGAASAGPAPSAEEFGRGVAGAPGFPPVVAGAPRSAAANAPTAVTPQDQSAGAAPGASMPVGVPAEVEVEADPGLDAEPMTGPEPEVE